MNKLSAMTCPPPVTKGEVVVLMPTKGVSKGPPPAQQKSPGVPKQAAVDMVNKPVLLS